MTGATKGTLRAIMREMETNVFKTECPGEMNQDEARVEAFLDSPVGTDATDVKLWVETMASDPGYDRMAVLAGVILCAKIYFRRIRREM